MTTLASPNLWQNGNKKMKKSNRELNTEHDKRTKERVRPKGPDYNFAPLEAVIKQWVKDNGK